MTSSEPIMTAVFPMCILYAFTFASMSLSATAQNMLSVNATQTTYEVQVGNIVELNCMVHGTATSVHWYFQYELLILNFRFSNGNLAIPTLTISSVQVQDQGFYYCQARNNDTDTTVNTDTIILEVFTGNGGNAPHAVTITPTSSSITVTEGQTISLNCTSHGTATITYTWFMNNFDTQVGSGSMLTIPTSTSSHAGTYTCRATNSYGLADSSIIVNVQRVQSPPSTISITPSNVVVTEGSSYTLTCDANGYPEPTFQWSKDGVIINEGNVLTVPSALYITNDGLHTCNATNKHGSVQQTIDVDVQYIPHSTVTRPNISGSVGTPVKLICDTNANPPATNWVWGRNGTTLGDTGKELDIDMNNASDAGMYKCRASNSVGQSPDINFNISVGAARPSYITITPDGVVVTEGETFTLTCNADGDPAPIYQWYFKDKMISEGSVLTVSNSLYNSDDGFHTCKASNIYGFLEKFADVDIQYKPRSSVESDQQSITTSIGTSVTLSCDTSANPSATEWEWRHNGVLQNKIDKTLLIDMDNINDAGTYTCKASNEIGQSPNIDFIVNISSGNSAPSTITITPAAIDVQEGTSFSLSCVADGNPTPNYQWFYQGNMIQTGRILTVSNALHSNNHGQYTCNATNSEGSKQKLANVNVQYIRSSVTQTNIQTPVGTPVTLSCNTDANPLATTWVWSYNGNTLSNTDKELPVDMDTVNDAGTYTCTASNDVGQSVNIAFIVSVENVAPSSVTITPASVTVNEGNSYKLTCNSDGIPAPSYQWLFKNVVIFEGQILSITNALNSNNHGIHTCKATNIVGSKQKTANVDVQYRPRSTVSQTTVQGPLNTTVKLSCDTVANPSATTWEWKHNGGTLSNTGKDLVIDMDSTNDAGTYTCKARNSVGQSLGIDFTVIVGTPAAPSTITITPANKVVQQGDSYTLTCNANGNPAPSYKWFRNGVEIHTRNVYTVSSASYSSDDGTHTCIATNAYGSVQSLANVDVQYIPESSVLQTSLTGTVGNPLNLTCNTNANPPATSWEWRYNGDTLTHTGKVLTIDMDTTSDTGTYTCRATNQVGTSNDIIFTVIDGTPPSTGATTIDTGLTTGEIAAIILALLFGLLLLIAILTFCCCANACAGCCGYCGRRNDQKVEPERKPDTIIKYYEKPDDYVINYRTLEIPRFHEVATRRPSAEYEINKYTVLTPDYNHKLDATRITTTDPETDNTYMSSNSSRQYFIPNTDDKEERRRRRRRRKKRSHRHNENYSDDHLRDNEIVIEERIVNGDVRHSSIRTSNGDVLHTRSSDYDVYT